MTQQYAAYWPIVDDTRTQRQLIDEATPQLEDMLDEAGLDLVTPPEWWVREAPTGALFLHARCGVLPTMRKYHGVRTRRARRRAEEETDA